MELRDTSSTNFVSLAPVRYQFAEPTGQRYDDNWLMVQGHARSGDEVWSFEDPALLVEEAQAMSTWMRSVAAGSVATLVPDADGLTFPSTQSIEPNIGLGLVREDAHTVTLRVFLWLESAPPSTWVDSRRTNMEFFLDLTMSRDDLVAAVNEWDAELAMFPRRV